MADSSSIPAISQYRQNNDGIVAINTQKLFTRGDRLVPPANDHPLGASIVGQAMSYVAITTGATCLQIITIYRSALFQYTRTAINSHKRQGFVEALTAGASRNARIHV